MSLESRVEVLEAHHKQMDANLHSLAKVCADIKTIALTNQHDIAGLKVDVAGVKNDVEGVKNDVEGVKNDVAGVKNDVAGVENDVAGVKACVAALAEATYAGFKRTDEQHNDLVKEVRENQRENRERFDQLELLIRQLPNATN